MTPKPTVTELAYARVTGASAFHKGLTYRENPYDEGLQPDLRRSWSEGYNNARVQTAMADRKI